MSPVVTATAAWSGLRPVAKALGVGLSTTYTRGLGMPARWASMATMACRSRASFSDTSRAPFMRRASLSEFQ